MSAGHVVRLLLLHLTLFITIAAFVVLVTQSFNTFSPHHWAAMSLLVFGAAIAATVVTIRHARSGAWTSVDDMADRF